MSLKVWARRVGVGAATLFVLSAGAIVTDGLRDDVRSSDVAVVLGSKVELNGAPSARLAARLDRAVELYRRGQVRAVIVSGGVGKEGFDEAEVMKRYLVGRRVPAAAILVDSLGVTTRATARNSAALMRAHGFRSAVAVTQYFHVPRTRLALRQAGVTQVSGAHARWFEWRDVYSVPREVLGYAAYLVGARD